MGRALLIAVVLVVLVAAIGRGTLRLMRGPNASGASGQINGLDDLGTSPLGGKATVRQCYDDGRIPVDAALIRISATGHRYLGSMNFFDQLRSFCETWVKQKGTLAQDTGARFVSRFLRENPSIYNAACLAGLDVDFGAQAPMSQYLTKHERLSLRRDICRLQLHYLRADAPVTDYEALIAAHPDTYVLACRASLQVELARSLVARKRFSGSQRRRIAVRSCREALRAGIVDADGARGLLDARVNQRSLNALILRFARQEARA